MERAIIFYRDKLAFHTDCKEKTPVCFFDTPGTKLELFPLDLLAKDINPDNPPTIGNGFGSITLAYNVDSKQKVNEVIELVRKTGETIVKEPQYVFWGGYHAYLQIWTDTTGKSLRRAYREISSNFPNR